MTASEVSLWIVSGTMLRRDFERGCRIARASSRSYAARCSASLEMVLARTIRLRFNEASGLS